MTFAAQQSFQLASELVVAATLVGEINGCGGV
jgi:hypothetical protein